MQYSDYLKTDYWKAVTAKVKERAGYRCQLCNSAKNLCAHHRTYDNRGNELNHLGDLTCLCGLCHEKFHNVVKTPQTMPDPYAQPKAPQPPEVRPEVKAVGFEIADKMQQIADIRANALPNLTADQSISVALTILTLQGNIIELREKLKSL